MFGLGQLGDGTSHKHVYTPTQVPGITGVTAVAAGNDHVLLLKSDGTVLAWGGNGSGQLGDGTTTTRLTPQAVPGLTDIVQVAAGNAHSVALNASGQVYTWGDNSAGQRGRWHADQSNESVAGDRSQQPDHHADRDRLVSHTRARVRWHRARLGLQRRRSDRRRQRIGSSGGRRHSSRPCRTSSRRWRREVPTVSRSRPTAACGVGAPMAAVSSATARRDALDNADAAGGSGRYGRQLDRGDSSVLGVESEHLRPAADRHDHVGHTRRHGAVHDERERADGERRGGSAGRRARSNRA